MSHPPDNRTPILLVDSETAVSTATWQHLRTQDGWTRPSVSKANQAHLMVQSTESWLLADPEALASYYGQGFRAQELSVLDIETIPRNTVYEQLKRATQSTKKGSYTKSHCFDILSRLQAAQVIAASPFASRLFEALKQFE